MQVVSNLGERSGARLAMTWLLRGLTVAVAIYLIYLTVTLADSGWFPQIIPMALTVVSLLVIAPILLTPAISPWSLSTWQRTSQGTLLIRPYWTYMFFFLMLCGWSMVLTGALDSWDDPTGLWVGAFVTGFTSAGLLLIGYVLRHTFRRVPLYEISPDLIRIGTKNFIKIPRDDISSVVVKDSLFRPSLHLMTSGQDAPSPLYPKLFRELLPLGVVALGQEISSALGVPLTVEHVPSVWERITRRA